MTLSNFRRASLRDKIESKGKRAENTPVLAGGSSKAKKAKKGKK